VSAPRRDRLPFAALGFGVAAALSSWNPLSAPFGVVVGLAALLLSLRALGGAKRRLVSGVAAAVSFGAVAASVVVLALTAGLGRELGGTPAVQAPSRADVASELDAAAERTRAARDRARAELDALEPAPAPAPAPNPPQRNRN
jgi:hypothetical protein